MGRVKPAPKGSPEKSQRKQRKMKDKDAPKRPCTAFFYYVILKNEAVNLIVQIPNEKKT